MLLRELNLVASMSEVERRIEAYCAKKTVGYICAVNANILVCAYNDHSYRDIVLASLLNFCDSTNVWLARNMLYEDKIACVPGPNLFANILALRKYKSFFIGTTDVILGGLRDTLSEEFDPQIKGMRFYSPPFLPVEEFDYHGIAEIIQEEKPDLIWVALGAPKQEVFMNRLAPYLNRGVMIGVGAAFNFHSGIVELTRAPLWMRKMHIEWMFRALQEPKKIVPRQLRVAYYLPQIVVAELVGKVRKR